MTARRDRTTGGQKSRRRLEYGHDVDNRIKRLKDATGSESTLEVVRRALEVYERGLLQPLAESIYSSLVVDWVRSESLKEIAVDPTWVRSPMRTLWTIACNAAIVKEQAQHVGREGREEDGDD